MTLGNQLRHEDDDIYGIVSSHPAACLAAAKAFGSKLISHKRACINNPVW